MMSKDKELMKENYCGKYEPKENKENSSNILLLKGEKIERAKEVEAFTSAQLNRKNIENNNNT